MPASARQRRDSDAARSPAEASEFTGSSRYGVDGSRRVMVPAHWRPPGGGGAFYLLPWPIGVEDRILALPPDRWRALRERLQSLTLSEKVGAALERVIAGTVERVELDRVGRICLPEAMARQAGIADEVELVGRADKFEIWNPKRAAQERESDKKLVLANVKSKLI